MKPLRTLIQMHNTVLCLIQSISLVLNHFKNPRDRGREEGGDLLCDAHSSAVLYCGELLIKHPPLF